MSILFHLFTLLTRKWTSWGYFDKRAQSFLNKPKLQPRDLMYISSRDYRCWPDRVTQDMFASFAHSLRLSPKVSLLEVGCGAGFIACGVSPLVRSYCGVDLSPASVTLASRLGLPNARFFRGNGKTLPFPDASFDCVLCENVFINIADLDVCQALIREMLRVTVPGGRILVANINDATRSPEEFGARVTEYMKTLPPFEPDPDLVSLRWMPWYFRLAHRLRAKWCPEPGLAITCHAPGFFLKVGTALAMSCEILPTHRLHPYHDFRFSVLLTKLAGSTATAHEPVQNDANEAPAAA